ncbi:MAG: tetratricopeptide repeat protein [Rhodospirillaceae bacterium]|nr:tetratricopeptide repeat protein [Rhodospirillaceae bacterium]
MNRAEKRRQQKLAKKTAATSLNQKSPVNQHALGLAQQLHNAGRTTEAESAYQQILQNDTANHVAMNLLGLLYFQVGKYNAAADVISQALTINPNDAQAYNNLGSVFLKLGKLDDALASYHKALAIRPDYVEAHYNIGNAFTDMGRLDDAIASYGKAIAINPDYAEAHNNLGAAFKDMGKLDDAIASYHKALAIKPDDAEAHNNLGIAYKDLGRTDEAMSSYGKAIAINPDYAEAHNNLGVVFKDTGRLDDAIASYRKALAIKPDFAEAHSNLLMTLNYDAKVKEVDIVEESRNWNQRHTLELAKTQDHDNDQSPDRRLRIGYVSSDLRQHSVSYFFEPLLAAHDPSIVETFCYAGVAVPDSTTRRLEKFADNWRWTVGMSNDALAEKIRSDGIDILIDLSGHTAGNRLLVFAQKPAPVQATWLGYPNTTGLEAMDYRIVDAVTDPENMAIETLVRLKNGFLCYRPPDNAPNVTHRHTNDPLTFGSFNNTAKISAPCIELWSQILTKVPDSNLLLKSKQFSDASTRELYRNRFADHGIDPERLDIRGNIKTVKSHLDAYSLVDVCLDSFPYNGTTTTCEALWMGVPVVTLCGDDHRSRVGASILKRVGLDDCVAENAQSYVTIAAELARDTSRRMELRAGMRDNMSTLCDGVSFAREMEKAYRSMWYNWCAARP